MLPKVATSQRTTLAASLGTYHMGMLVADTTAVTGGLFVWDGTAWQLLQTGVPTPVVWDRTAGNAFLVNSNDNVGIGTNTPIARLEIRQATGYPILQIGESATSGGQLQWDAAANRFTIQTNSHADPITIGNNWLNLTTAGNVGIGTTSPPALLSLGTNSFSASVGQANPVELLRFDNAFDNAGAHTTNRITLHNTGVWKAGIGISTGGVNYFSGDSHRFWVGHQEAVQGTQVMTIDQNGRVGIGTPTPLQTLHVQGGFQLQNGSQAAGRVLTSDAYGNATWQAAGGGTASNGLTKVGDDYRLGGTLTQNTSIANALKNFEITGYT
jgi:hypothetical protein